MVDGCLICPKTFIVFSGEKILFQGIPNLNRALQAGSPSGLFEGCQDVEFILDRSVYRFWIKRLSATKYHAAKLDGATFARQSRT